MAREGNAKRRGLDRFRDERVACAAPEVLPGVRVCNDEAGGGGGGGRVRVRVRHKPHWKGHVTARGGSNHAKPSAQSNGRKGTVVGIH